LLGEAQVFASIAGSHLVDWIGGKSFWAPGRFDGIGSTEVSENRRNWAGNYLYGAARLHRPQTVEQVQELVRRGSRVKALGSRHSFNGIADTAEDIVSLEHLDRVLELDPERRTAAIEGGVRYGQLCHRLHELGFALHNLASLPHISVAGACATATHGSGDRNGNLATAVAAMEIVAADGELVRLSRGSDGERFGGAVVGLGGLGVVTRLVLDVVPAFDVRQDVYQNLPLAQLEAHFDAITSSAYSVSLFTNWRSDRIDQIWLKRRIGDDGPTELEPEWFGATLATADLHPIAGISPASCTPQLGAPGPWHERMPHFRMTHTPSSGEELQSEYFVPRQHAFAAVEAIARLRQHIAPHLHVSELRTIAADELWMSPCYRQACVAIHFTWKQQSEAVATVLPRIEEALASFAARPHWGKLFTMPPERVASVYEKLPDFRSLLRQSDPTGKFRNRFLDRHVFGGRP
jgi:alditol oxidase